MANIKYMPSISYNMLVDLLRPHVILSEPTNPPQSFKWVSSIHWEKGVIPERDMLFVCREKVLDYACSLYPDSFLIVIAEDDYSDRFASLSNQAIVIRESEVSAGLLQKLQNYFLAIQAWQNEMEHLSLSEEGLKQALIKSSKILGVPLLLYNANYDLIARSGFIATAFACKVFAEREREVLNSIFMLQRTPATFKGTHGAIYVENNHFLNGERDEYYLMALHEKQPSAGQQDLFAMVFDSIASSRSDGKRHFEPAHCSVHSLFDKLIHGEYIGKGALGDCAFTLGFSLDAEYRLLCLKPSSRIEETLLSTLVEEMRRMNGGKCLVTPYETDLLVLLYSNGFDSALSNPTIEDQLSQIHVSFDGFTAMSQVFQDIANLGFAYQETELVAKYKDIIDLEVVLTTSNRDEQRRCYTFEEILRFSIVDYVEMSSELKDFAFSHTILDKIVAEDIQNGSNDTRILASYMHHERKATVVAEKLHMHRNTVLYRIEKIEKRFGLNFNESWSRDRVLFDFSILYCKIMRNPDFREKLLGNSLS